MWQLGLFGLPDKKRLESPLWDHHASSQCMSSAATVTWTQGQDDFLTALMVAHYLAIDILACVLYCSMQSYIHGAFYADQDFPRST